MISVGAARRCLTSKEAFHALTLLTDLTIDDSHGKIDYTLAILGSLLRQSHLSVVLDGFCDLFFETRDLAPSWLLTALVDSLAHEFPRKLIFQHELLNCVIDSKPELITQIEGRI